jgi:hypothetical protein
MIKIIPPTWKVKYSILQNILVYWIFLNVLLHELSHAIIVIFTLGKIEGFYAETSHQDNCLKTSGYVQALVNPKVDILVNLAPLFTLIGVYFINPYLSLLCFLSGLFPSSTDFQKCGLPAINISAQSLMTIYNYIKFYLTHLIKFLSLII